MNRRIPHVLCTIAIACGLTLINFATGDGEVVKIPISATQGDIGDIGDETVFQMEIEAVSESWDSSDVASYVADFQAGLSKLPVGLQLDYMSVDQDDIVSIEEYEAALAAALENTFQWLGSASPADQEKVAVVVNFFVTKGKAGVGPSPAGFDPSAMLQSMVQDMRDGKLNGQVEASSISPSQIPRGASKALPPGYSNVPQPAADLILPPPSGEAPMSPEGALLAGPGMFPNIPPECSDDLRNSELLPQGTEQHDGITGNLIFRTVCNTQGNEKNFITLPTGRNASNFGIEAATSGKVFFGVGVEDGVPVWTTADGKAAFDALHLTSTTPSPNGKYVIKIDPAKSDPGVRVTVSFIDHP